MNTTDMELEVQRIPGQISTGEYSFEIKDRYTDAEAMNVFREVLEHGGLVHTYEGVWAFYDVRNAEGERKYMASISIPLENTLEWAEERLEYFKEHSISYFRMEGYSHTDYSENIALWLMPDENSALTKEEIGEFFNSTVDIAIREQQQKDYEEWIAGNQQASDTASAPETEPVIQEPAAEEPVIQEPAAEEPAVTSGKYSVEETIEIYKNAIIAGGYKWDLSTKGNWDDTIGLYPIEERYLHDYGYTGASWGTGYIDRSDPAGCAKSELKGLDYQRRWRR